MNSKVITATSLLDSLALDTETPSELQLLQLKIVSERARPFSGAWEFPWLLTTWDSFIWETTNGNKTRKSPSGTWIGTVRTNWDILLPDGHRLTDPLYANLLETCRRLSALARIGYASLHPPAIATWTIFNMELLRICNWMVLNKNRYLPAERSFKLLDQAGIKQLFLALAQGGWCEALSLVDRCLGQLYFRAFNDIIPEDLLRDPARLPSEVCVRITDWLRENDGFSTTRRKDSSMVSRTLLGELMSASTPSLFNHDYLDAVLRQFEGRPCTGAISLAGRRKTEFPRHTTQLLDHGTDQRGGHVSIRIVVKNLQMILNLYRHLPDQLPLPIGIKLSNASAVALPATGKGHTPFIPIDVGFKYLNTALKWVVLYGDALVDYFLLIMERYIAHKVESESTSSFRITANGLAEKIFAEIPLPTALSDAGFSFSSYLPPSGKSRDHSRLREKPSLYEALGVLVGAVTITVGLLKPARDLELVNLPIDCLSRSPQGLYWLNSLLGKRTRAEGRAQTGGKPIPSITARALRQIYRLNRGLTKIFNEEDPYKKNLLFYLPNPRKLGAPVKPNKGMLNKYLDLFCDFVGLVPDEHGRRWYLRNHEMRKWFLLLLFWSGRYDVLDAARWIAGHTHVEHLYDYIQREFPEAQLGKLEAECAIDQLAQYDLTRVEIDGDSIGLVQLYERVLRHFRVASLSLLKEKDWQLLVEELFEEEFHLEPYSISSDDGSTQLCVAVRVGPRKEVAK